MHNLEVKLTIDKYETEKNKIAVPDLKKLDTDLIKHVKLDILSLSFSISFNFTLGFSKY